MIYFKYLFILAVLFCACQNTSEKNSPSAPQLIEIETPCIEGGEPNLFVSETGQVYLSWVEYLNDTTDALLFSKLKENKWTAPRTIASGSDWFVNWADFPSVVAYEDNGKSLAAHWLQKSAEGTYDYDVHIAQSFDYGNTWKSSFIPHRDKISAEHGFVSMLPLSKDRIFATWLDGRNTKGDESDDLGHGHQGAMTLRSAIFDSDGNLYEEAELDDRVCDCCQTSAALTEKGVIVAYRDRSEDEIRDIATIRNINGKWTSPSIVFEDNWHIAGCPVNGASIKADGAFVAIAWYSMPDGEPQVKVAFSDDGGENFYPPIRIDSDKPLGRVDIVLLPEKEVLVSWLEKTEKEAAIKAVKVNAQGKSGKPFLVTLTSASNQSGFPVMAKSSNEIVFAWTNADSLTRIKTAIMNLE